MSEAPPAASQAEEFRELQLLLELSRRVAGLDRLDAVLETLLEVAMAELGADRGSLFLHDDETGELYTEVASELGPRQIRMLDDAGVAGAVFHSGRGEIVHDAATDPRFNREIDLQTGFTTRTLLCVPVQNAKGETIGVVEMLNKADGSFDERDLALLARLTTQCASTLETLQLLERTARARRREIEFLNIVSELTSELELGTLLSKVMTEASRMLDAERCTLFLNDERTGELYSYLGQGLEQTHIRFPNDRGVAGTAFTSQQSVNIPHAYADLRFNPEFDRQTGFFTRSILCVPVFNKAGKVIGATQALNRRGGPFTAEDESRLRAFTAQIAIGLENAKLFADVQAMKNYNESMLESMSNGVVTFDGGGVARTCNSAGARILRRDEAAVVGRPAAEVFGEENAWVLERMQRVGEAGRPEHAIDAEVKLPGATVSANVTVLPLQTSEGASLGTMVMIEDISSEKRVRATLSRYMDPALADRLLEGSQDELLGGKEVVASVLFSDIRSFTTLAETLGPQATVALLNEYFGRMVECISAHEGMLDKFVGDALMAVFGLPVAREDDEDRALRAAIEMVRSVRTWNAERGPRGEPLLDMGIGISTDLIVAGNIGSPKRMDYTFIGDGVNLAARLETACKQYAARILVSEYTRAKLKGVYRLREVDRVIVRGKTMPVSIYECLDYHDERSFPNLMEAVGAFEDGIVRYRHRDFESARRLFQQAAQANPHDGLASLYVDRCAHMLQSPPPAGWDGVWVLAEK